MDSGIHIVLLVVLLLSSAFFSSSEVALFSLSEMRVKAYQNDKDRRKRLIGSLLAKPRDLLVTVFMLNTLINILIQNVASDMFEHAGWLMKVGFPLVITLLLGELIPKYIGLKNNVALSFLFAPTVDFLQRLMKPIRAITIKITDPISRILFFYLRKERKISKEEIQHALQTSQEHGLLKQDEAQLLQGYLNLHDSLVKEIMRPRDDILHYMVDEPLTKLEHLFVHLKCSRVPVCEGDIDNVLGILSINQYFIQQEKIKKGTEVRPFLRKAMYTPESIEAWNLFQQFEETGEIMALVVDEYGSISGLITHEDLAETVIGEIKDKRDQKNLFTRAGKDEIIASGRMELEQVNDLLKVHLESAHNQVTIGGWLMEKLEEIPKTGTKFTFENLFFHVLSAEPNRIRRVYIRKLDKKG